MSGVKEGCCWVFGLGLVVLCFIFGENRFLVKRRVMGLKFLLIWFWVRIFCKVFRINIFFGCVGGILDLRSSWVSVFFFGGVLFIVFLYFFKCKVVVFFECFNFFFGELVLLNWVCLFYGRYFCVRGFYCIFRLWDLWYLDSIVYLLIGKI